MSDGQPHNPPGLPPAQASDRPPIEGEGNSAPARLEARSAAVVDGLLEQGFGGANVQDQREARSDAERLARARALLALLETPPAGQRAGELETAGNVGALIDVTMARIAAERHRGAAAAGGHEDGAHFAIASALDGELDAHVARALEDAIGEDAAHTRDHAARLTEDDADALDALVMAGFDASRVAGSLRGRAERIERMRRLLVETPVARRDAINLRDATLVDRTMELVEQRRSISTSTRDAAALAGVGGGTWRLRELVSIAAVLVLGAGVLTPVLSAARFQQQRTACASNLAGLTRGMSAYGGDFGGSLPMASASLAGRPWWNVGRVRDESNSANLFTLRRAGYNALEQMACAGNAERVTDLPQEAWDWQRLPQVSYSYFVMFAHERPDWTSGAGTVVLADRSPVVLRATRGQTINPLENSPNHGGSGQWLLRADGSAVWADSPLCDAGTDNIWLPADLEQALAEITRRMRAGERGGVVPLTTREQAAERRGVMLRGTELPTSARDAFLGP